MAHDDAEVLKASIREPALFAEVESGLVVDDVMYGISEAAPHGLQVWVHLDERPMTPDEQKAEIELNQMMDGRLDRLCG